MYNFNKKKNSRWIAIVVLAVVAAMLITTVVSGFFLG